MPRKRVRIGMDQVTVVKEALTPAPRSATRSTLPLARSGSASRTTTSCGAHARGCAAPTQSPGRLPAERADHERHDPLPPLRVVDADHLRGHDVGVRAEPGRHRRQRHLHTAADHHVVEPAEHLEPAVLVEAAGVGGVEPPVHQRLRRQPGVAVVPVEEHRPGEPDPPVGAQRDRHPVERHAVVHAPAGGLRRAVRRHHPDAEVLRARPERRVDGSAAEQHRVHRPQRRHVGGRAEQPVQLGRDQRGVRRVPPAVEDRRVAGQQGPDDHLHARDVRRRQGQRPAPGPAEPADRRAAPRPAPRRARAAPASGGPTSPRSRSAAGPVPRPRASRAGRPRCAAGSAPGRRRSTRRTLARLGAAGPWPYLLESSGAPRLRSFAVARRRAAADAAGGGGPGAGRDRGRVHAGGAVWWKALLALVVSLALQVGVNYANDYSDGIRGTDDGPGRPAPAGRLGAGQPRGRSGPRPSSPSGSPAPPGWCSRPRRRGGWWRSGWCRSSPRGSTPAAARRTAITRSAR